MQVSLIDFKTILAAIKEENIRLKIKTNTGWSKDYLYILGFIAAYNDGINTNFHGIVLSNMTETEGILINNISTINAFELEHAWRNLKGGIVYNLRDNISFRPLMVN